MSFAPIREFAFPTINTFRGSEEDLKILKGDEEVIEFNEGDEDKINGHALNVLGFPPAQQLPANALSPQSDGSETPIPLHPIPDQIPVVPLHNTMRLFSAGLKRLIEGGLGIDVRNHFLNFNPEHIPDVFLMRLLLVTWLAADKKMFPGVPEIFFIADKQTNKMNLPQVFGQLANPAITKQFTSRLCAHLVFGVTTTMNEDAQKYAHGINVALSTIKVAPHVLPAMRQIAINFHRGAHTQIAKMKEASITQAIRQIDSAVQCVASAIKTLPSQEAQTKTAESLQNVLVKNAVLLKPKMIDVPVLYPSLYPNYTIPQYREETTFEKSAETPTISRRTPLPLPAPKRLKPRTTPPTKPLSLILQPFDGFVLPPIPQPEHSPVNTKGLMAAPAPALTASQATVDHTVNQSLASSICQATFDHTINQMSTVTTSSSSSSTSSGNSYNYPNPITSSMTAGPAPFMEPPSAFHNVVPHHFKPHHQCYYTDM